MIILDTDAVTFLEYQESVISKRLRQRLAKLSAEHEIVTTVVTYDEQTRGWFAKFSKAADPESVVAAYGDLLHHLETFKQISVIGLTLAAEAKFRELRKQKIRVATRDLRIAAIALTVDATLMTRNLQDFRQVPKLQIEDWTKPEDT